jgi:dienelactone hydrolase
MPRLLANLLLALISLATQVASSDEATQATDLEAAAGRFVEQLVDEQFDEAVEGFDATMTRVMPPEKLKAAWTAVLKKAGPFERQVGIEVADVPKFKIGVVTCEFEGGTLDVRVVFDSAGKITGLWFAPSASDAKYQPPSYANHDAFDEQEVRIGTFPWSLPGTLSIPRGEGPFPAVVLVHGSGPNDRDETIGPNKPFRDLAWGLASQGIAVLRYEKRTKHHALKLVLIKSTITVKQETIDDALEAVALLRQTDRIDAKRVFVLGHSLGGMLLPRIGKRDPEIAGFIVFAGTTRPLEDVILDQRRWLFELDGELSAEDQEQLGEIQQQVARVKDPQLSVETEAADLPLGVHPAYWLDLRGYDPAKMAQSLEQPMLILQGGRDYQVTMEDYNGWKNALSSRHDVRFVLYPNCNHLFAEGDGQSTPAEYQQPGNVAQTVIHDIVNWIGAN